jgi:hypothetical protein
VKRPAARAGRKAHPKLRLVRPEEGRDAPRSKTSLATAASPKALVLRPRPRLVGCADGFCSKPDALIADESFPLPLREINPTWAKLAAAIELFPGGLEIPGLGARMRS